MEVLTKPRPSNSVLENETEKTNSTLNYENNKGEKTVFDVHHYGKKGVLYFKKK